MSSLSLQLFRCRVQPGLLDRRKHGFRVPPLCGVPSPRVSTSICAAFGSTPAVHIDAGRRIGHWSGSPLAVWWPIAS